MGLFLIFSEEKGLVTFNFCLDEGNKVVWMYVEDHLLLSWV